jgi:hypothetical protein
MEKAGTINFSPIVKLQGKIMQYMLNGTIDWDAGCRLRTALQDENETIINELWSAYIKDYPEEA